MPYNTSPIEDQEFNRQSPLTPYLFDLGLVALLGVATVAINLHIIRYGLNGHGDLLWHITWIQHFSKEISEGIWYPRWLAGTNLGYGSPTFVFYPPLAYYLGSAFKAIGLTIEQTMTTLFSLSVFLSGVSFYIYGRNKWGRIPAFVGAVSFMTCPSIAYMLNGGGLASIWAFPLIPLGLYLTDQSLVNPKWRIALAVLWTVVALTHVPSLLIYIITWLFYILFALLRHPWKSVIANLISAGIGLGIASFFLVPAILEQRFVDIDYMRREDQGGFQAYMVNFTDLFKQGISDVLIQQALIIMIFTAIAFIGYRHQKGKTKEIISWLTFVIIVLFLMSHWSWLICQHSKTLQMIQSTGRLTILVSFGEAALCAIATSATFKLRLPIRLFPSLIILAILLVNFRFGYQMSRNYPVLYHSGRAVENINILKIALYNPYSDQLIDVPQYRPLLKNRPLLKSGNLNRPNSASGQPSGSKDKGKVTLQFEPWIIKSSPLLKSGSLTPPTPLIGQPSVSVLNGKAQINIERWESYNRSFKVIAEEPSIMRIRTYYYPAWNLYVNNKPHAIDVFDDGTMGLKLNKGSFQIELKYHQLTRDFILGIILSLLSILGLILWAFTPLVKGKIIQVKHNLKKALEY